MERICVYAASSPGADDAYAAAARDLGQRLVARGIGLVYGGRKVGQMGAIADAVLEAGGEAIGIIPRSLHDREVAHTGLTDLRVVGSMHERKALMAELSGAFIALPGGLGTLEELVEVATWSQLRLHDKPIGLLDVLDYWRPLEGLLDHMVGEGFLRAAGRELLVADTDPDALLDRLEQWKPPAAPRR